MKNKTLPIILFFLVLLFPIVNAVNIDYDDDWDVNEGTEDDAFVWGGGFIDVGLNSLTSNADIVCWDWTDNGYFNHCYFENSVDMYECDDDYTLPGEDGQQHSPSYYYDGHCQLGDGWCDHTMETGYAGENWDNDVDAIYFEDCDGAATYTNVDEETFYVVDRHMYDCDNGVSIDYDYEAYHSAWQNVDADISCGDVTLDCDENHDGDADGDNNVWTETGIPDDPCRILDGYTCNNDDECISDDCDGEGIFYNPVCDYDGSIDYTLETEIYTDTCGGDGDLQTYVETTYACTLYLGSGYICDSDLDETGDFDYSDFCKKDVGETCNYNSDCWNDNGGYDCNNGYCSKCGDGLCSNGEDYNSCPDDCPLGDPDIDVDPNSLTFNIGQ